MSDSEGPSTASAPRRSQRERKQAKPFVSGPRLKRKRTEGQDEDEHGQESDQEGHLSGSEQEEDAYTAPRATAATRGGSRRGRPKGASGRAQAPKATGAKRPEKATRRRRAANEGAGASAGGSASKGTKLNADNHIFNAIMNPSTALQSTVEDFLDALSNNGDAAYADLVNCMLRACGCNESVDEHEAVDFDGVVDKLDNITEVLKQDDSPIYPLTSKLPTFKKFRKSLSEFLERLITSSADTGALYTTDLIQTFQVWVVAMSSSQLRSFRHTATVLALEVETALCEISAAVEKEAEVVARQLEVERKRKGGGGTKAKASPRVKELTVKADEIEERRTALAEYLRDLSDGVFVNRYRDLDPSIRAECIHALGQWFKKYLNYFIDQDYLRYVGWTLSDSNNPVRLESVKALSNIYQNADSIGSLHNFTERFKTRLIEMATSDTDLSVRVTVIQILSSIDRHGLLDDDQRSALCLLVFDHEARVRKAVSGFVQGVWKDLVAERLTGSKASEQDESRVGVKALGLLLVQLSNALERSETAGIDEENASDDLTLNDTQRSNKASDISKLAGADKRNRTALVVEALWDDVEPMHDWSALLDLLLLDHSAGGENSQEPRQRRAKARKSQADSNINEAWRLEESEEAILLEVLVASLRKVKASSTGPKKTEDETTTSDITRELIKAVPRLFAKHQADERRITIVLTIVLLMDLDLYLEMRVVNAYTSLWDDVIKQYTSHTSSTVLSHAISTIRYMLDATSLSNTNSSKIVELEDELASSLRDIVAGRDELEKTSFSEDEAIKLGAVSLRISTMLGSRDMTAWMEEDEGGKQSSIWDILISLAERGKLGYKEEEEAVVQSISALTLHIIWKARYLAEGAHNSEDDGQQARASFVEQRQNLLDKLVEFAVGSTSHATDSVRRVAFQNLMNLHVLFNPPRGGESDPPLLFSKFALSFDNTVQYSCADFVQAEIEQYADELSETLAEQNGNIERVDTGAEDSQDEDARAANKRKRPRSKANAVQTNGFSRETRITRSQLEREYILNDVVSTFVRAIKTGTVHWRHCSIILTHYSRLGLMFDQCAKNVIEVLREEGMYNQQGETVTTVVTQSLRQSFTLFLEGVAEDETHSVALAKALVGALMIRGAQLSVVRRLEGEHLVTIHTTLLNWCAKRIGALEADKNKKSRNSHILFFRVLQPILTPVEARDALRIKAHMDQVLAQAKVEVSPTSAAWEPQRAYERRLNNIMIKGKGGVGRGRKGKTADPTTTDEEAESGLSEAEDVPRQTRPQARIVRNKQTEREASGSASERGNASGPEENNDDERQPSASPLSPQDVESPRDAQDEPASQRSTPAVEADAEDENETPKARRSRKRTRDDDDPSEPASPIMNGSALSASEPGSPGAPANQTSEHQITFKRIRR